MNATVLAGMTNEELTKERDRFETIANCVAIEVVETGCGNATLSVVIAKRNQFQYELNRRGN